MTTDLNQQLSQHFEIIYQSAWEDAQLKAELYFEKLQLHSYGINEQLLILLKELGLVNQETEDMEYKEYFQFATDKENCFKIYSSRLLFYNQDEKTQLRKGCILSERNVRLTRIFGETKLKLPPFTFSDFRCNKRNVVFYEIGRKPLRTTDEDYLKIRNWQTKKKVECVTMEATKFKQRFIESVGANAVLKDHLDAEIQKLECVFKNIKQLSPREFIAELVKLKALSFVAMPENENEFHDSFCKFKAGDQLRSSLTPQFFESSIKTIKGNKISNPPVCCWSFIKYDKWLYGVRDGEVDLRDVSELQYDQLFAKSFQEGYDRSQRVMADFKIKYPSDSKTVEEYKPVILGELDNLRIQFNSLKNTDYYYLLPDTEAVKNCFINNCLLDVKIEIQSEEFKETVVLYNMIAFLQMELLRIDKNPIEAVIDQMALDCQITDTIASMVPKSKLINQLLKVLSTTLIQAANRKYPILFIAQNLKDALKDIYDQAVEHLLQLFDSEETSKKAPFVSDQYKDMLLKERSVNREGRELNEYFNDFKGILAIELDYLKVQPSYNAIDIEDLLRGQSTGSLKNANEENNSIDKYNNFNTKALAYNYKPKGEDRLPVVFEELNKLKAISEEIKLPQFRKLFNGLPVNTPLNWYADQGDLMVFIREAMNNSKLICPRQQHWNIAIKCFVKADGTRYHAKKLKSSQPTKLQSAFEKAAKSF